MKFPALVSRSKMRVFFMPIVDHKLDAAEIAELNQEFSRASAAEIVRWAIDHYRDQLALTCSFGGSSGMALLDLALQYDPTLPVLVLDTELLFSETYALIDNIEKHYGISVQRIRPALSLEQQSALYGSRLYATDPDRCCQIRKVDTLNTALEPYAAWLTALRRDQSAHRANTPFVSWNERYGLLKICPLAQWSEKDVWRYLHEHSIPYNTLLDQGYSSLGCAPCTQRPLSDDARSGRWVGFKKTECGLHL